MDVAGRTEDLMMLHQMCHIIWKVVHIRGRYTWKNRSLLFQCNVPTANYSFFSTF